MQNGFVPSVVKKIEIPLYNIFVFFLIGDEDQWRAWDREYGLELDEDDFENLGITSEEKAKSAVFCLIKSDSLDYDTLCHELTHVVDYVSDMRGLKLDASNDETQAHLAGFIGNHLFEMRDKFLKENFGVK